MIIHFKTSQMATPETVVVQQPSSVAQSAGQQQNITKWMNNIWGCCEDTESCKK